MQNFIDTFLQQDSSFQNKSYQILPLTGQASAREYFRVKLDEGPSFILMKIPGGFSSLSEEVTKNSSQITELPFINIQRYFHSLELPVPQIHAFDAAEGLMLLDDLGDVTLEQALQTVPFLSLYEKALSLLIQLQTKIKPDSTCIAFSRSFDADLLFWEWQHFLEYGIEDRFQKKISSQDREIFEKFGKQIVEKIIQMPQGFVHRDFQSRNLMLHHDQLFMIDFQDALLGPSLYDLVALLRDSYIFFTPEHLDSLLHFFAKNIPAGHPYFEKEKELRRDFDLITIQRKLKDTGRFQYIHTVKKNPSFLPHVPLSLQYVKQALDRQAEFTDLNQLLGSYLPEWNA